MKPNIIQNEAVQRVTCTSCAYAYKFQGNTNWCDYHRRRVCSCQNHGRACQYYEPKH